MAQQPDPQLSAIVDKMIAAGESDADIGLVMQEYHRRQGPTLGKQVKDFVTELGGGLGKQVYESTPFAHTGEAWEQVKKIPDLLRHPIDTFKRESEASAQQGRTTLDLFRHPADTGAALAKWAEESLVGNDEMTLGGRVGRTLSNVLPFVAGGAGVRAGSLSRAARAAKVAEEAEKATLAEKAAQEAASMAGLRQKGEARAAAKFAEEEALRKLRSSGGPAEGSTTGTSPVGSVNAPVDQPFTVAPPSSTPLNIRITVPREEGLAGATRIGAGRTDRAAGISDAVPSAAPISEPPPTVAANAAAKAEIDAEGGLHMPERRGSERVRSEAEDKAYQQVRREQERKAALARAKATLTPKAPATPLIAIKDDAELPSLVSEGAKVEFPAKSVGSAAKADLPPLGGKMAEGPTVTLPQMLERYGPEEAAQRAGMSVDELHARVASGGDPEKLAQLLRERLGAEKAGRALGMAPDEVRDASGGGPSKLPSRAVEAIKATIARKEAAGEPLTSQDQVLLDRIKREGGFSTLKTLAPIALGGGGAAYGYTKGEDEDTREGNALLGAGGGVAAGWALTHPRQAAKIIQHLRIESMLSGAAIPKNIMNYVGAPVRAAIEGIPQTGGRWAAAREMFGHPVENLKNFGAAFTKPGLQTKYGAPAGIITRAIGAGDTAASKALQRAGMGQADIERLLLTKNRNLFPPQYVSPKGKKVLDFLYPFQRVPYNVFMEGAEDVGHAVLSKPDMRTALTLAQAGGGYALGKWAKGNKKRQYLGQIALALLGPGTAIGTAGAMAGSGAGGNFGWGGISPIPEETLDPKAMAGWPPGFVRAYRKLKGQ